MILPGVGLGELVFGIDREEVRYHLGEPDDVDEDLLGPNPSIDWHYRELGVSAYFSEEDEYRLGLLDVERPDVELRGRRLIGLSEDHVRAALESMGFGDGKTEILHFSDHPTLVRLMFAAQGLDFWFQHDKLENIQVRYLIGPDDEIVWPETT